ncbi:metallophosphoesterase [Streptomyces purpurascens]
MKWLEKTLRENKDSHAVIFSHHTSKTMTNLRNDPSRPGERRHDGQEVLALLGGHRNVLAWVNGHIHKNVITPHSMSGGGTSGRSPPPPTSTSPSWPGSSS